jgi:hypothetical protein
MLGEILGSEFKILQTNNLGERCIATPDIAQDKLFIRTIRTETKLYCITNGEE